MPSTMRPAIVTSRPLAQLPRARALSVRLTPLAAGTATLAVFAVAGSPGETTSWETPFCSACTASGME